MELGKETVQSSTRSDNKNGQFKKMKTNKNKNKKKTPVGE